MVKGRRYFFFGTFLPLLRASERPIAIACFRLVTFLPLRPDFSLPRFIACISRFTSLPADGEYLRRADFFDELFLCEVLLRALLFFALDFFALDFLLAFFVAITILPGSQMADITGTVVSRTGELTGPAELAAPEPRANDGAPTMTRGHGYAVARCGS